VSTPVLSVSLEAVAVLGPGLPDWGAAERVLTGQAGYEPAPIVLPSPIALPAVERRRTGRAVRLALALGFEAAARGRLDPSATPAVFSSSGGDGHNCHEICSALAASERQLSPTRFHNSVHNAPAGYWSIAAAATATSTSLCAYDASFAAALLEASTLVMLDRTPVLLIAYDTDYPEPLRGKRPIPDAFGVALALRPDPGPGSLARLAIEIDAGAPSTVADPALEQLRREYPAARSLPLLSLLARRERGAVVIEYLEPSSVSVEVEPCG
jgi:Beta-ketoacyl synthase, N-terminal domain